MKPEITTATDPKTGGTSVLVNNCEVMTVNADGTIDAHRSIAGSMTLCETIPVRSKDFIDWVRSEADKIPVIAGA